MFQVIAFSLCASLINADIAHLKSGKAKLLNNLAGRGRHHKRGALGSIPTFKLGHDIPYVSHSVLKPLVVTYPPTTVPFSLKVPVPNPHIAKYPVPVGHKVPVPHPHYGLKFPQFNKPLFISKPEQHYHHHHHHVTPKPVVPLVPVTVPQPARPAFPVAQPTAPVTQPVPAPPSVFLPTPVAPPPIVPAPVAHPIPLPVPSPPLQILPQEHVHLKPIIPTAPIPFHPAAPIVPVAPQYDYYLRPGNSIQSSLFATYPKYPLLNYPTQFLPTGASVANQFAVDRPQVPQYYFPQGSSVVAHQPTVLTHQVVPTVAVQTTNHADHTVPQPFDHNGWSPLSFSEGVASEQTAVHEYAQEGHHHHITQEQGAQIYEHHSEEQHYQDHHDHVHNQIHQLEQAQAQYEQSLNNQHQQEYAQSQAQNEYDVQQHINQEYAQSNQEYGVPQQHLHQEYNLSEQQLNQEYRFPQQHLQQEYGSPDQQINQEYELPQQQLKQEYGLPHQGVEGRNFSEDEASNQQEQAYHNHIPLGLQPPIDRPLEHF